MKKRIIAFILTLASISGCLVSCSVSEKKKYVREYFGYFDTFSSLTVYTDDGEKFDRAADAFDAMLKKYDALLDVYEEHKEVTGLFDLNENAGKGKVKIDKDLFDVLAFGKEVYLLTEGKTNIALGSVTALWHDAREYAKANPDDAYLPCPDDVNSALLHTDINSLILDEEALTAEITDGKLSLDAGAVAKGFISQKGAELLSSMGFDSFLINLGGNVLAIGSKPYGSPWTSLIENPFNDVKKGYSHTVELKSQALVTSGSYQRYFTVDGKIYSHIIDSKNGLPSDNFVSVSVLCPASRSGLADGLSTALFCMSVEEGKAMLNGLGGVEALWIFPDGSYEATDGFGG